MFMKKLMKDMLLMLFLGALSLGAVTGCTMVGVANGSKGEESVEETVGETAAEPAITMIEEVYRFEASDEPGVIAKVEIGVYGRVSGLPESETEDK